MQVVCCSRGNKRSAIVLHCPTEDCMMSVIYCRSKTALHQLYIGSQQLFTGDQRLHYMLYIGSQQLYTSDQRLHYISYTLAVNSYTLAIKDCITSVIHRQSTVIHWWSKTALRQLYIGSQQLYTSDQRLHYISAHGRCFETTARALWSQSEQIKHTHKPHRTKATTFLARALCTNV